MPRFGRRLNEGYGGLQQQSRSCGPKSAMEALHELVEILHKLEQRQLHTLLEDGP